MIPRVELLKALKKHLTAERVQRIEEVSAGRTRKLCLVLEDLRQEHNVGAMLRTADVLGLQDVHLISENHEPKLAEAIAKGSTKWVNLHRYQAAQSANSTHCFTFLKDQGFKLITADPEGEMDFQDLEYRGEPMALIMGNEGKGLSSAAKEASDLSLRIPQYGFTQSFNVSVAGALILNQLNSSMRKSSYAWQLEPKERENLELQWVLERLGNTGWHLKEKIKRDWLEQNT